MDQLGDYESDEDDQQVVVGSKRDRLEVTQQDNSSSSSEEDDEDDEEEVMDVDDDVVEEERVLMMQRDARGEVYSDLEYIASFALESAVVYEDTVETSAMVDNVPEGDEDQEDSESEEESDSEEDEGKVMEEDSSSSDDSDDDEEDDNNGNAKAKSKKMVSFLTEEEADSAPSGSPRTKHEVEEDIAVPPLQQIQTANASLTFIGEVLYHMLHEQTIVIQASYTTNPLREGSILCNAEGTVAGVIHEIFGPVTTPFYVVRYKTGSNSQSSVSSSSSSGNNNKKGQNKNKNKSQTTDDVVVGEEEIVMKRDHVEEVVEAVPVAVVEEQSVPEEAPKESEPVVDYPSVFAIGCLMYTAPSHAQFLTSSQILMLKTKGSDASNVYDEEPPEDEIEYSDDEQEMLAKQAKKKSKHPSKDGEKVSQPQKRVMVSNHVPQSTLATSYSSAANNNSSSSSSSSASRKASIQTATSLLGLSIPPPMMTIPKTVPTASAFLPATTAAMPMYGYPTNMYPPAGYPAPYMPTPGYPTSSYMMPPYPGTAAYPPGMLPYPSTSSIAGVAPMLPTYHAPSSSNQSSDPNKKLTK